MKHRYPTRHGPESHWTATLAWGVMDNLRPGAIPDNQRFLIGGLIAGAIHEIAQLVKEGALPPKGVKAPRLKIANIGATANEIARRFAATPMRPEDRLNDDYLRRTVADHAAAVLMESMLEV